MLFASVPSVLGHIKAGRLRALAVTGPTRAPEAPSVQTMQELGFAGFDVRAWNGILAPAGTPKTIGARLNRELATIVAGSDVQDAFKQLGLEPTINTPEEFAARIKSETAVWADVIKAAGIKAE